MSACPSCSSALVPGARFCAECAAATPPQGQTMQAEAQTTSLPKYVPPAPVANTPGSMPIARYCQGCGSGLVATASVCPQCGTAARTGSPKSKSTAVLLAVFLSFWSWLYTYRKNTWKFWVGLGVAVLLSWMYFLPPIAVWIWAIVDNATKPDSFFQDA